MLYQLVEPAISLEKTPRVFLLHVVARAQNAFAVLLQTRRQMVHSQFNITF